MEEIPELDFDNEHDSSDTLPGAIQEFSQIKAGDFPLGPFKVGRRGKTAYRFVVQALQGFDEEDTDIRIQGYHSTNKENTWFVVKDNDVSSISGMASNFLGPDIHDSEIVRRYQQMVPALKDKLEKTIRLYANMVRQHADCHDGDVFRLDTSEYSRQLSDVIRHLDEMQLLLNTISSWGSLPTECLYTAMNASEPEGRDALGRQLDFNALEVEGRAQLERMLGVQAVLQKCRPMEKKKEEVEENGGGVGQFEVKTEGTSAASDTMDTDEGQQQTTTTMTSGDDDEEEEDDDDDDEEDEEEDEEDEDEEEERSAAAISQHDSIAGELSPPALLGGRTAIGTPVNPGSVPVQSIQTPPPPPPPRPSTTSGRVSTPQHLHSVHASPVDGMSYRPKEEIRSGPPSFDGGSADLRLDDGSSNSPMTTSSLGPSTLSALMRAGSHGNSPASLPDAPSGEVPISISSLLQPQVAHRNPPALQSHLVVPKSEPTSQAYTASQQAVKLEVMDQEECQN